MIYAIISEAEMVAIMIGKDCLPFDNISVKFRPNPSKMTENCSIFLDVNVMPGRKESFFRIKYATIIPIIIANTGPPITGKNRPNNQDGMAIQIHNKIPFQDFFIKSIIFPPL